MSIWTRGSVKMKAICFVCNKELNIKPSRIKERNFCSYECHNIYQKGKKLSKETRKKMSESHKGIEPYNKGKTLEELHGLKKSKKIKEKISFGIQKMWMKPGFKEEFSKKEFYKSREYREKMSRALKGKTSEALKGRKLSEEHKNNIIKSAANNPNFGMRGKNHSDESKKKMSLAKKGYKRIQSEDEKKNRRIYFNNKMKRFKKWHPNFNENACKYFENFDKENNTQGQYATNGGEFYIKELGYWVDYINHDLKLIIEYDEPLHYDSEGSLRKKDAERQKQIENFYNKYEFKRILEHDIIGN